MPYLKRVLLLLVTGLFMSLFAVTSLPRLKQVDRFLTRLTAITPVFGKKQMVIRMEICSTARGGLITYQ
ncbi:hypothetical protein SC09_Contig28orf00012 [Bacillus subtilis]|uniref:Uncharacterized protein n=1 Tax=Bacillus subtilis TaxID=1423 RepID=A0A0D1KUG8_BACIU|nr:hypothetical protein SC09_Contig28orf00012 [Bacillus subtilis]